MSEAVLIHEFDDATDFLEFHGKKGVGSWMDGRQLDKARLVRAS